MESMAVTIRFHEELSDFLPRHEPGQTIAVTYHGRRTVKDLIESLGVPHVEIDNIRVHGETVNLDYLVRDQDDIDVHPGFCFTQPPHFVVDDNVAKLVPLLRMLGFDTLYAQGATDSWIATISKQEGRTIVSRDKGLLKRKEVHSGLYVRSTRPPEQLHEVVRRLRIRDYCQPFTRCLNCNGILVVLEADEAALNAQIPSGVRTWTNEFFQCQGCHKVFWKGSHHQSMERLVHQILHHP
jgi:uncharacterized protein with PIN domain